MTKKTPKTTPQTTAAKKSKAAKETDGSANETAVRHVEVEIVDDRPRGDSITDADAGASDATENGDYAELVRAEAAEWEARGWRDEASQTVNPDQEPALPIAKPTKPAVKSLIRSSDDDGESVETTALATSDPVALYMADVKRYPLLTREQEQELALRYREHGDARAAEALVTSNLRFVVKVAAEYSRFGARLIDLIQEGNVGLMHAVREFNPYKGVRLITYAVWWIRGYIQDYLMRQYSMVRIGTTQSQRKLFYRLQKEKDLLESMGEQPTVKLLSSRLGVSEEDIETMTQRMQGRDVSLQTPVDDAGKTTILDFEPSDDKPIDEQIGDNEMLTLLRTGIDEIREDLNDRERELLEDRLLADEPLTLQQIGEKYGVTREAVRQMENRLMLKIRKHLEERLNSRAKL